MLVKMKIFFKYVCKKEDILKNVGKNKIFLKYVGKKRRYF